MPKSAEELFAAALGLTNPAERGALLDRECAGNPALRAEVESLLAAHEQASQFLENPPAASVAETLAVTTGTVPVTEKPGDKIGRYKLLQQIGEGGCGVVYMAEQEEPVRRRVALKVIKLGMDTRQVIARFEAERQALALMDHPNIAKVLDAGATETGRPYFVMELVRGIPITRYCDENRLNTTQRLELFILVCQAIQHAHQKRITNGDRRELPIIVGRNVAEWWKPEDYQSLGIAWRGTNEASRGRGMAIGLFKMTWENPSPDVAVQNIDFLSKELFAAPFLVAITVEP